MLLLLPGTLICSSVESQIAAASAECFHHISDQMPKSQESMLLMVNLCQLMGTVKTYSPYGASLDAIIIL